MASSNAATLKWHEAGSRNREIIRQAKDVPCADCGNRFPPVCMDFDHREPEDKERNIGHLTTAKLSRLTAEIAKCDVVCANCHRIRTDRDGLSGARFGRRSNVTKGTQETY